MRTHANRRKRGNCFLRAPQKSLSSSACRRRDFESRMRRFCINRLFRCREEPVQLATLPKAFLTIRPILAPLTPERREWSALVTFIPMAGRFRDINCAKLGGSRMWRAAEGRMAALIETETEKNAHGIQAGDNAESENARRSSRKRLCTCS